MAFLLALSFFGRTRSAEHHAKLALPLLTIATISGLLWAVTSLIYRLRVLWVGNELERLPGILSPYKVALIALFAVMSTLSVAYLLYIEAQYTNNPLPFMFYAGSTLSLFATAVMAPRLYGALNRAHYVTLLLLAITVVVYLLDVLFKRTDSVFSQKGGRALAAIVIALSVMALTNTSSQLIQNRLAWERVEVNINNVKAGVETTVYFPEDLPCRDLTWYYWPEDHERSYQQLSIYYNTPENTAFRTIPQDRGCLRIF